MTFAIARYDEARAVFSDIALDQYPIVTADALVDKRKQVIPGFIDKPAEVTTYRAGFDAFWELDVFGRVRSAVHAAEANAQSYGADLEDVRGADCGTCFLGMAVILIGMTIVQSTRRPAVKPVIVMAEERERANAA